MTYTPEQTRQLRAKALERHWARALGSLEIFIWGEGKLPGFCWTVDEADQNDNPRKRMPDRPMLRTLAQLYLNNKKLDIMKSRQLMVTWFMCCAVLHMALSPGKRILVFTKQEKGSSKNLDRIWEIYNYLPAALRPKAKYANGVIEIDHPVAKSYIQAAVKNTNDPRQDTLSMIWIDESAFAPETLGLLGAALPTVAKGGRLVLTSTPNGREITYLILTDSDRIPDQKLHRPFANLVPEDTPMECLTTTLTNEPQLIQRGMIAWKNLNGYACLLLHFTGDPESSTEAQRRDGSVSEQAYERENNLDFASFEGTPVFVEEYNQQVHEVRGLQIIQDIPLWMAHDFGRRHPAVTFHQFPGNGKWNQLGEVGGPGLWLGEFLGSVVIPYLKDRFPEWTDKNKHLLMHAADIAGMQGTANSKWSAFQIMQQYGFYPMAKKQGISDGLDIIKSALIRTRNGEPGFQIDPDHCPTTVEALRMGYRYPDDKPNRPANETPLKDGTYDHWVDTMRYVGTQNLQLLTPAPVAPPEEPTYAERALATLTQYEDMEESWWQ